MEETILNKLKIIWKEVAVAYFEVAFQYLFGATEGNHERKKSQPISRARFELWVFQNTNKCRSTEHED
jgi:hypothetical protein